MANNRPIALVCMAVLSGALTACGSTPPGAGPGTVQPTATGSSTRSTSVDRSKSAGAAVSSASPAATESNPPGDIPDNQAFVTFTSATGGYLVKVPEGWARTASGTSVTFTDKLNSISVLTSATAAAPTVVSVTNDVVPNRRSAVPQFTLGKVVSFTLAGGSGVHMTYLADSAADPVTNKVVRDAVEEYFFWSAGRLTVLRLTGAQNADNVDPWTMVTGSFRWTK